MWRETVAQSTAPPSSCCTQGKWTFLCICYLLYTPPVSHCRPPAFISGISSTPPAFISGTLLYIFGGLFMYSLLPSSLLNFQINFFVLFLICSYVTALSPSQIQRLICHTRLPWAVNSTKFLVETCTLHMGNGCHEKNLTAVKLCNRGWNNCKRIFH